MGERWLMASARVVATAPERKIDYTCINKRPFAFTETRNARLILQTHKQFRVTMPLQSN